MMQTQTLPIQISGATPAPARQNSAPNADANQFSQALSREVAQRQAPAAPAPTPTPAPASAKAPVKQANGTPADKPAAAAKAPADSAKPAAAKAEKAAAREAEHDAAAAAQAAAATPVVDMLALVASFNQPLQVQAVAAAPVEDSAGASAPVVVTNAPLLDVAELPAALEPVDSAALPVADDKGAAVAVAPGTADFADQLATQVQAEVQTTPTLQRATASAFERIAMPKSETPVTQPVKLDAMIPQAKPVLASVDGQQAQAPLPGDAEPLQQGAEPVRNAPQAAIASAQDSALNKPTAKAATEQFSIKEVQAAPAPSAPAAAPLQQAALAQSVANAATDKIPARVGTPGWDNQVGQKIVWMVAGKEQSASLTLNPPDMGPMQVVLNVTNDQASVTFTAAQPEVRQALEDAMPRLREMMSESGISLGQTSVNAGTPEQRQAQGEAGNGGQGGRFGQAHGGNDKPADVNDNGSAAAAEARAAARGLRGGDPRAVDTFA